VLVEEVLTTHVVASNVVSSLAWRTRHVPLARELPVRYLLVAAFSVLGCTAPSHPQSYPDLEQYAVTGVKYVGFQGNGIVNDFRVEASTSAP
jgi:hypothetical protein